VADKHKGKLSAKDVQEAQDEEARDAVRGICRAFGHALTLTIMSACLPAGHVSEDEAIEAAASAWETLADKIIDFAKEN
jgi:hypothetical protein